MVKNNTDRAISTDRRAIADMRRINLGFNTAQYYPGRVHTLEELARLLVPTTVSVPEIPIEATNRDIASAVRIFRLRPALSLVMCTELPMDHINVEFGLVLFCLVMPFGRNGAPSTFAIFGDAVSAIHPRRGKGRADWFFAFPFLS